MSVSEQRSLARSFAQRLNSVAAVAVPVAIKQSSNQVANASIDQASKLSGSCTGRVQYCMQSPLSPLLYECSTRTSFSTRCTLLRRLQRSIYASPPQLLTGWGSDSDSGSGWGSSNPFRPLTIERATPGSGTLVDNLAVFITVQSAVQCTCTLQ